LYIPLVYILTFTHEYGHAITGIIYNLNIIDFKIDIYGTSYVEYSYVPYGTITSITLISGSLGAVISGFFIITSLISKKRIRIEVLLPIFYIVVQIMVYQIQYWILGVIYEAGDSWAFLQNDSSISPSQLIQFCYFLKNVLLFTVWIIFIIKIGSMVYANLPDFRSYFNNN
jgi:hypothetical protein